jgi:AcrR family transcriptional regulator
LLAAIEDEFATLGRTPKGQRALRSIFRAMLAATARHGAAAIALEAVAGAAGLTQAAIRHYFPTRDHLLLAFFRAGAEWYRRELEQQLAATDVDPLALLERCLVWHLDFMEAVDAALWFESSGYWLRDPAGRRARNAWYQFLVARYAQLIGRARPGLSATGRRDRAIALWTLMIGGWVSHSRGSALQPGPGPTERRRAIIAAGRAIIGS